MKKGMLVLLAGALAIASCKKDDAVKPVKSNQTQLADDGTQQPPPPPPPPPGH